MDSIDIEDYIRPLLRWWWLLALAAVVAAASNFVMVQLEPQMYRARATLMVGPTTQNPNPSSGDLYLAQQLVTTYVDLAQRDSVRMPAMESLGLDFLPEYTARQVPATQLMELTVMDSDAMRAQAVAQALADQLIAISPAGSEDQARNAFVDGELDALQASIVDTKAEIKRKQEEMAQMLGARQIADSQAQITALEAKLTSLQTNFTNLMATTQQGAINTVNLIEQPAPGIPVGRGLLTKLLTAAAIGLLLAAGAAYVIEYLDNSFKNSDEVQKQLNLATLAAIPILPEVKEGKFNRPYMLLRSQSAPAEAFRILRTNLQFAAVTRSLRRLLVTSALPAEGKSDICANLGVAVAQTGRRVIIIDGDLHRPRQHKLFGLVNNIGLTTALLDDEVPPEQYVQRTALPTLGVLTTGPLPPNAAELLGSQRMRDLLDRLQTHTDLILIDTPPTTVLADAALMTAHSDSVLLVVQVGKTNRDQVKRALAALHQVNSDVLGVVLNFMPTKRSGYYYSYSHQSKYYRREDIGNVPTPPVAPARMPNERTLAQKETGD
jgi:capsular exopolysaccharide synthesis family protein